MRNAASTGPIKMAGNGFQSKNDIFPFPDPERQLFVFYKSMNRMGLFFNWEIYIWMPGKRIKTPDQNNLFPHFFAFTQAFLPTFKKPSNHSMSPNAVSIARRL